MPTNECVTLQCSGREVQRCVAVQMGQLAREPAAAKQIMEGPGLGVLLRILGHKVEAFVRRSVTPRALSKKSDAFSNEDSVETGKSKGRRELDGDFGASAFVMNTGVDAAALENDFGHDAGARDPILRGENKSLLADEEGARRKYTFGGDRKDGCWRLSKELCEGLSGASGGNQGDDYDRADSVEGNSDNDDLVADALFGLRQLFEQPAFRVELIRR